MSKIDKMVDTEKIIEKRITEYVGYELSKHREEYYKGIYGGRRGDVDFQGNKITLKEYIKMANKWTVNAVEVLAKDIAKSISEIPCDKCKELEEELATLKYNIKAGIPCVFIDE